MGVDDAKANDTKTGQYLRKRRKYCIFVHNNTHNSFAERALRKCTKREIAHFLKNIT